MKLTKLNLAVLLAAYGLAQHASAEQASELAPVTLTASPINQHGTFDVPSQINVLTDNDKSAKESGSLADMLEPITGVNNLSSGSQSGKPVIRGMTGNRVKVLSNGQTTDYQAYGNRHNPNMDPYLAERIEVIRGPQSVLFGSEALAGVVNVMQSSLPYGQHSEGEVAAEYNTNNQEKMIGTKIGMGSDRFAVHAGASIREADNFHVPTVSSSQGATPSSVKSYDPLFVGEVLNTNFKNRAATLGMGYQQDWGLVELRFNHWHSLQNYLGIEADNTASEYEAVAAGQKLQNDEMQFKAEFFTDSDWVIKPSWSHIRNQREATHDLPFETMAQEKGEDHYLDVLVRRNDYKLAFEHPKIGGFEGELGVELTDKDQILRSGHLTPTANVDKKAIYLFEETEMDNWLVQFGARYDTHSVEAPINAQNEHFEHLGFFDETNNERDFGVLTGSFGANYRLDGNWSVAANLGQGFRAPSIFELYAGGEHGGVQAFQLGNPDLDAETSLNADLSLRFQSDKTQMVATLYNNSIKNYIYLANTGFYRYSEAEIESNGALDEDDLATRFAEGTQPSGTLPEMQAQQTDARIFGAEFSLNHQFDSTWSADLGIEIIRGEDTKQNRILPLIPANNARVAIHYQPKHWQNLEQQKWSLNVKLVDAKNAAGAYEPFSQFDSSVKVGTSSTRAYAVYGLSYQAQVKLDKQNLKVSAAVENLFDTAYIDFLNTYKGYTLNSGRNFKLTMKMDF
ncbi:TonB-dependent receptor [Thiomicrorhabdus sediminis]|uniref:TonB-dependent receptor n=1 Tax=Thiomicrorhabdus sediminis TaxID=2580412 RepID=A0A4P9K7C8_9GAMM|nr:TonB-dependent receptor [Thiomicrorhabdus sediminis]QCU90949.1 TonB-dependent receptor [Thiomicrorhabdus sediminis]